MNNLVLYKVISKFYDLLDVIYFKNDARNPRKALSAYINQTDARILDICTGTATNAIEIAKHYKTSRIIGIDISREMLQIAKKKVKQVKLNNVRLYKMNASDTKFKDSTFDVIVISLVLHEIPLDVAGEILLEARRILKPEGRLLVMDWEEPKSSVQKMLFYPVRKLEPKGFEEFLNLDLPDYFQQFGLEVAEIKHCDYTKVLSIRKATAE